MKRNVVGRQIGRKHVDAAVVTRQLVLDAQVVGQHVVVQPGARN